jgi:hypothetical protein
VNVLGAAGAVKVTKKLVDRPQTQAQDVVAGPLGPNGTTLVLAGGLHRPIPAVPRPADYCPPGARRRQLSVDSCPCSASTCDDRICFLTLSKWWPNIVASAMRMMTCWSGRPPVGP